METRNSDYLNNVILPIYRPYLFANMLICICDKNGIVQFTTELWNQEKYRPGKHAWHGISITDYNYMEEINTKSLTDANRIMIDYNLRNQQINESILLSKKGILFIETNFPLVDQNGSYVGIKHLTREISMPNISMVLRDLDKKYSVGAHLFIGRNDFAAKCAYKLDEQQEVILFLLSMNFSQQEIASFLQTSRSNVARKIGIICEEFGIYGNNTKLLIEKCLELDLLRFIPPKVFQQLQN